MKLCPFAVGPTFILILYGLQPYLIIVIHGKKPTGQCNSVENDWRDAKSFLLDIFSRQPLG